MNKHAVHCHLFPSCVYHDSHLLLIIGERHFLANCLFSSISFFLWACDVQFLGEAKLVKDHCRGTCFAQVARTQPFHLLHSEAARVSMESRSKAGHRLRWQWQRLANINTDIQTSGRGMAPVLVTGAEMQRHDSVSRHIKHWILVLQLCMSSNVMCC